ncbi:hypothetical protein BGW38_005630 [Lunasporangiospora selenospora]|uniref:Uncharacterized protein n=1 Tax=Lunasporangiospora selenospora TaxID=979761 RepID=A0A9P6G0N3_9FUNG|nr:hypothetical protein BGW38_005630 [Lunasporangiospora selenospora]
MGPPHASNTMHLSTAIAIIAASALTIFADAALTPAEKASIDLKAGFSDTNYCGPCLSKAMNNHFPHACAPGMNSDMINARPAGPSAEEEHCLCVAFQDLSWMKADCSAECPYVHQKATMKYFLPSSKIEGCDKWINFETGEEKVVDGHGIKDPSHVPEVFAIADAPPSIQKAAEDDKGYDVTINVTMDDKKKEELESGSKEEAKEATEKAEEPKEAEPKAAEPQAEKPKEEL